MALRAKICLLLFAFIAFFENAKATHIVGGEMTYVYLGNNQYKLRLDLYIDCINGNSQAIESDKSAFFAIYFGNTKQMVSGYPVSVSRKGPNRVSKTNYNCLAIQPNACVDHYWYERTVTLAPRTGGYYISFQRCCRNETITNIIDPGGTGANYWAFIPNEDELSTGNSSSVFTELPPNFLCTNTPLRFDHSAIDPDGDSLVYSLTTPYTAGTRDAPRPDNGSNGMMDRPPFNQITWRSAYSNTDPINGNPKMTIDPETGFLTLVPTMAGQFVVGISVKEYRNGKFITETIRDYQFNVQSCVINVMASFFAPKFICGYDYTFSNYSQGAQRYFWDFGVANKTDDTSNQGRPSFTFPAAGKYTVMLVAYKNNCSDTFKVEVNVVDPVLPKLPEDTTLCMGQTLTLKSDIVGDQYFWNTGVKIDSMVVTKPGRYILGVSQKSCVWYDTIDIDYDQESVQTYGDTLFCSNETFKHKIGAILVDGAKYSWSNNSNNHELEIQVKGNYIVTMTSKYGCITQDTIIVDQFPDVSISVRDTIICKGIMTTVTAVFDDPNAQISWSTGAKGPMMSTNITGTYFATATIGRCSNTASFKIEQFPDELDLGPDIKFCNKIDTLISVPPNTYQSVIWNDEVPGNDFKLDKPGLLKISVLTKNGCVEKDSINILLFYSPFLNLGADTTLCLSVNPTLNAGSGMASYRWNNGQNSQKIIAYDSGLYSVEIVSTNGCKSTDSILINKRKDLLPSDIFMPNAFTPNGDGLNDLYPNNQFQIKGASYRLMIYNRWGEKLGDWSNPDGNWDGYINGKNAPEGVYIFQLTWIGCDNLRRNLKGDFTLLR